jgi:ABC-type nitrate/sulfonate/bicarbonate transport system substrate-binding protein
MQRRVKRTLFSRCLLVSIVVLFVAGLPVGAAADGGGDLPVVKVVYWRSIDDLPLYVGVEKGYFEAAGIKVKLEFIKGEENALAGVIRGDVDAGYISLASLIKLAERKAPIKVVMWMGHAHPGTKCGIHVGAQTGYQSLADVKGMRLASSGSINSKTMLTHALAKGGHTMKDIRALWGGTPDNPMQYEAALRSGGIDGFIV